MVESVEGGRGRGQVTASTGRGHHRGCAGQAVTSLRGGPPARVQAEEARGQDAQLQEDHSSACNRINGQWHRVLYTDTVSYDLCNDCFTCGYNHGKSCADQFTLLVISKNEN